MLAATLLCIYAPTIELFLLGRILQASAAAGIVLSQSHCPRYNSAPPANAASMIGYVTMGMTLAPDAGACHWWHFWQPILTDGRPVILVNISHLPVICACGSSGLIWEETNRNLGGRLFATPLQFMARNCFSSHRFLGDIRLCCAFSSGAFFAFLGGGLP